MKSDRVLVALEILASVVMLVAWGAVAIVADEPLRAGGPTTPPAAAASAATPVMATARGAATVEPS